jgi:hypothetical protein
MSLNQPPFELSRHPHFTPWTDPQSGAVSYVLTERVAPVQQSFYFCQPGVSRDERWMWIYCGHPPHPVRTLGVVSLDPAEPYIRHFPHAAFSSESPLVAADGRSCYHAIDDTVWRTDIEGRTEKVLSLPASYIAGRRLYRLATHLTLSADGTRLLLDGDIGNQWFVGTGDLRTGEFKLIKEFGSHHNHAQFSPVDPEVFLIAQDWWFDKITGRRLHYDNRIWLMDTADSRFKCLTPDTYCDHHVGDSHEWWTRDGRIGFVDYQRGGFEVDPKTGEITHVWKEPLCHAHCDSSRRYWCADESPYKWSQKPCEILFFDRQTGTRKHVVTGLPPTSLPRVYHVDPHPQFTPGDSWIAYTTTVHRPADVALAPVGQFVR